MSPEPTSTPETPAPQPMPLRAKILAAVIGVIVFVLATSFGLGFIWLALAVDGALKILGLLGGLFFLVITCTVGLYMLKDTIRPKALFVTVCVVAPLVYGGLAFLLLAWLDIHFLRGWALAMIGVPVVCIIIPQLLPKSSSK